jgi:hypothetical protein
MMESPKRQYPKNKVTPQGGARSKPELPLLIAPAVVIDGADYFTRQRRVSHDQDHTFVCSFGDG